MSAYCVPGTSNFNEGTKAPPKVAPGTYTAKLTVGSQTYSQSFEVRPMPGALYASGADLKAQYDLLAGIRDSLSKAHETVMRARELRAQATAIGERAKAMGKGDALAGKAKALAAKLTAIEDELTNPEIIADEDDLNYEPKLDHDFVNLAGLAAWADARPTKVEVEYYGILTGRLDAIVAKLKEVETTDVAAFNRAVQEAGIPPVSAGAVGR